MGRLLKNTDKLLEKYGDKIAAIYHHDDCWEVRCWHAGPQVNAKGNTLGKALQELENLTRKG